MTGCYSVGCYSVGCSTSLASERSLPGADVDPLRKVRHQDLSVRRVVFPCGALLSVRVDEERCVELWDVFPRQSQVWCRQAASIDENEE